MVFNPEQALRFWKEAALQQAAGADPDLTVRQTAILLTVYLDSPPHTVRGLAAHLNVTKPVITRALDSMGEKKLISRRRDDRDRRNVLIQRTVEGALYIERLGDMIIEQAAKVTVR